MVIQVGRFAVSSLRMLKEHTNTRKVRGQPG